jgi:hypothetical protein
MEPVTENLACAEKEHHFIISFQASAAGPSDKSDMKAKELAVIRGSGLRRGLQNFDFIN